MEGIAKCPICGGPYKWYSHTVSDQSACPRCVREANEACGQTITTTGTDPESIRKVSEIRKAYGKQ